MLDGLLQPPFENLLKPLAEKAAQKGLTANQITVFGFMLGLTGCFFVALQIYLPGLLFILAAKLCDTLDGMVARLRGPSVLGDSLDTLADLFLYAAFVFMFILGDLEGTVAGAFLIFAYLLMTAASFSYRLVSGPLSPGIPFGGGFVGHVEITVFMTLSCLYPPGFAAFASLFGILCCASAILRVGAIIKTAKKII